MGLLATLLLTIQIAATCALIWTNFPPKGFHDALGMVAMTFNFVLIIALMWRGALS